jgi:transcriptional regulator with PAS, ATPase and Fis domain
MEITNWVKIILDSLYDGVLIINKDAVVQYVNPSYTRITTVKYEQIVGRKLRDVRPGARLPKVLETGEKILRAIRLEDGIEYIVNMSPIFENGEITGGISLVKGINDVKKLSEDINKYQKQIKSLRNRMKAIQRAKYSLENIVAYDSKSKELLKTVKKIAKNDTTVLINGESGTGKELYAHAIHNESNRIDGPFVAVNCAAIQSNLLESELFGYEEGAFTGSIKGGKIGLFEAANGGTIFLDEISEMDYKLQSKLLRTLQENSVRRIGSIKEIPIDVRVVAATNRKLEDLVEKGKFREDLYYRISIFPINILPLRERKADIIPLVKYFIEFYENKLRRRIDLSEEARDALFNYNWPGNIRELKNCIEFSANMLDDNYSIRFKDLPRKIQSCNQSKCIRSLEEVMKEKEYDYIKNSLEIYGETVEGKKKAAKALDISLASLYNKLKDNSNNLEKQ